MAQRKFIVLGDTTSHGGTVITANSRMTIDGKPVACVGDLVVCPRCSGTHVILGSGKKT
ncbi:MAG: PAAR domain-containing protein, partial [Azoarcus sp.]|nr:PAAR domain-containing protein [Azoarcus sp.]